MATGEEMVFEAMRGFVNVIPNKELIGIQAEDREFYRIGEDGTFLIYTG